MFNRQYAKAFLKDNHLSIDEKNRYIGTLIGEELTKLVEKMFRTYEEIRAIGQQETPEILLKWVQEKFQEITKRDSEDYNFQVITSPDFTCFGGIKWNVYFELKPIHERLYNSYRTITTSAIDSGYVYANTISANTIDARHITTESIRYDGISNATIRNLDAGAITAGHIHNGWGNAGEYPNYTQQLPPVDITYNGTVYREATIGSIDTQYPYGTLRGTETYAARPIDTVRVTERYGIGIMNTEGMAAIRPITLADVGGNNNE